MRSGIAIAAIAAAAGVALLGTAHPAVAETTACAPGPHKTKVRGQEAIKFCGPAKAVVRVGSKTVRFSGGECRVVGGHFTINIGTSVGATFKGPRPDYFGMTTQTAKAGKQRAPAIAITFGGKGTALWKQSAVLARGLKRGTFTGKVFFKTTPVSGSFTC